MASSTSSSIQPVGVWKTLSADTISVTLKFGFYQSRLEYRVTDTPNAIIDRLYREAERWLREIAGNLRTGQLNGRYTIHLFRIPATEFTMVPIIQPSDIEQNSIIEIVLVPIEMNQNPHSLYRCQLNVPTNCSKCTRFIAGLYKQGYRCHKCRMTYHKDCAPFLVDDCLAHTNGEPSGRRPSSSSSPQLTFINPFVADPTCSTDKTMGPQTTIVPIFRTSATTTRENAEDIAPNKIIEKGIFPACIRGTHFYRRYLFRLTTNALTMTTNLSPINVSQSYLSQTSDLDIIFPLIEMDSLVLTHFAEDRDSIFEVHLRNRTVISVGKKTDSDELQMETAQFYSTIRDQRETLINANPAPSLPSSASASSPPPASASASNPPPASASASSPPPASASPVPGPTTPSKTKLDDSKVLMRKTSIFRLPPLGKDNEHKDLHEVYAFTGEKIGEGAFGRVVGAYKKSTREEVAVKIMEKANCSEQDIRRINEEINNLYKFNHVNILKLEAYYERDDAVYIVTERMETDMCKYINKKKKGYLSEDICKMITYQLIVAVRYLHGDNCGHLDIKCENILISLLKPIPSKNGEVHSREYPLVKLADFGYSRIIGEHSFRKTRVGTKVYNAPEIYRSTHGYNRLADMWSVGIVLYAALSGTLPYDEKGSQRAEEIVSDKSNLFGNVQWERVSKDAKDLIADKLLVVQPTLRITSSDALFDNWFTDFDLYTNLREIEKRTKYLMNTKQQELPISATWLTGEREDLVWTEYRAVYTASKQQSNA